MRNKFISYTLLSIVLFLVSCGKDTEYSKIIPADVDMVAAFDCERIMKESGLLNTTPNDSQAEFKAMLQKNLSAGEEELLDKIFSNPQEVGVDWTRKVYSFVPTDKQVIAFLFPISDINKLKNSIQTFAGKRLKGKSFGDEGNYSSAVIDRSLVAVTDQACLILSPTQRININELKEIASSWLDQTDKASFVSTDYHDMLLDLDGEIGVFASMKSLPENISVMASMAYPEDMDIRRMNYLMEVSFEKGKLVADGKLLFEDEKLRDWFKNNIRASKRLKGSSLSSLPKSTPLWMGIGLKGDDLFDIISEHPVYGKELEKMRLPFDLEGVVRSINGDFSFAFPHGLFVDVENDEILKICVGGITTMGRFIGIDLNEIGKDQYQLIDGSRSVSRFLGKEVDLQMGMKDDSFYLVTDGKAMNSLSKEETLASAPWADDVDDNVFFTAYNFQTATDLTNKYTNSRKQRDILLNYFDYITYAQKDFENNQFILSFVNQERNVIEQLIELYVMKIK